MNSYRRNFKAIILFIAPAFLIYTILGILPIFQSFYFSFHEWSGIQGVPLKFVGLDNFKYLLEYKDFLTSIKNILRFVLISLVTQVPLGLLLAFLLSSYCKGFKFFKAAIFMPIVLSITAVSLMWYFILFPGNGVLSSLLSSVGLESLARNWLADKSTALNTLILVNTWISGGYYMTIFFAAITSISEDVLESALIDGSLGIHKVIKIIIPMIWDVVVVTIVMVITGTLKIFDLVFIMTKGGPNGLTNVPASLMFSEAFSYNHYGLGSAISTVIFAISIIFTVISLKIMQKEQ